MRVSIRDEGNETAHLAEPNEEERLEKGKMEEK